MTRGAAVPTAAENEYDAGYNQKLPPASLLFLQTSLSSLCSLEALHYCQHSRGCERRLPWWRFDDGRIEIVAMHYTTKR